MKLTRDNQELLFSLTGKMVTRDFHPSVAHWLNENAPRLLARHGTGVRVAWWVVRSLDEGTTLADLEQRTDQEWLLELNIGPRTLATLRLYLQSPTQNMIIAQRRALAVLGGVQ